MSTSFLHISMTIPALSSHSVSHPPSATFMFAFIAFSILCTFLNISFESSLCFHFNLNLFHVEVVRTFSLIFVGFVMNILPFGNFNSCMHACTLMPVLVYPDAGFDYSITLGMYTIRSHKEKRSSYAPESGVRYDGVYRIEKCWRKKGIQVSGYITQAIFLIL